MTRGISLVLLIILVLTVLRESTVEPDDTAVNLLIDPAVGKLFLSACCIHRSTYLILNKTRKGKFLPGIVQYNIYWRQQTMSPSALTILTGCARL
jgi:hypothetical protein